MEDSLYRNMPMITVGFHSGMGWALAGYGADFRSIDAVGARRNSPA